MVIKFFLVIFFSQLISTKTISDQPTVEFRFDGAPDALVFEVCGAISLKNLMADDSKMGGWGEGLRCFLRVNKTFIQGVSLTWSSISDEKCFTVSVDPIRIDVAGHLKVQALVCDWEWSCEFGLESLEVGVYIDKNPFRVKYLDQSTAVGDNVNMINRSSDTQLDDNWPAGSRWKFYDERKELSRTMLCDVIRNNPPLTQVQRPLKDTSNQETVDTLIVFAFSHSTTGWREDNLLFWLAQGLIERGRYYFVLIINGDVDSSWRQLLDRIASQIREFEWLQREDTGRDVCAWHSILSEGIRIRHGLDRFRRFILINSSCRGPFVPSYMRDPWPEMFLSLLSNETKLAGVTVNCNQPGMEELHIQSYLLAFDRSTLSHMLHWQDPVCPPPGVIATRSVWQFELTLTHSVIRAGGNVAVTQFLWSGADFRDSDAVQRVCAVSAYGDVLRPGAYSGMDVHPLELGFFKTNRAVAPEVLYLFTQMALVHSPGLVPRHVLCG